VRLCSIFHKSSSEAGLFRFVRVTASDRLSRFHGNLESCESHRWLFYEETSMDLTFSTPRRPWRLQEKGLSAGLRNVPGCAPLKMLLH